MIPGRSLRCRTATVPLSLATQPLFADTKVNTEDEAGVAATALSRHIAIVTATSIMSSFIIFVAS